MINSFVLLAYLRLTASRTFLELLLAFQNFTLDSEDLFWWYKRKSDFYKLWQQYGDRDEWRLTWYFWWMIYTSVTTGTCSESSPATAKASGLKISAHGTSLKWSQKPSSQDKNSYKLCDETRHLFLNWQKVNGNWDSNMVKNSQWNERKKKSKQQDHENHS